MVNFSNDQGLLGRKELLTAPEYFVLPSLDVDFDQSRDRSATRNKVVQADRWNANEFSTAEHRTKSRRLDSSVRPFFSTLAKPDDLRRIRPDRRRHDVQCPL